MRKNEGYFLLIALYYLWIIRVYLWILSNENSLRVFLNFTYRRQSARHALLLEISLCYSPFYVRCCIGCITDQNLSLQLKVNIF